MIKPLKDTKRSKENCKKIFIGFAAYAGSGIFNGWRLIANTEDQILFDVEAIFKTVTATPWPDLDASHKQESPLTSSIKLLERVLQPMSVCLSHRHQQTSRPNLRKISTITRKSEKCWTTWITLVFLQSLHYYITYNHFLKIIEYAAASLFIVLVLK